MKPFAPLAIAAAALAAQGAAPEPGDTVRLALQDVLVSAMRASPLVHVERLDVDIARRYVRESLCAYEPDLSLSFSREADLDHGDLGAPRTGMGLSVEQATPGGGAIAAEAEVNRPSRTGGPRHGATTALTFTQALLQGGGLRTSLAPVRAARLDLALRQEELAAYAARLLADTERAYWELYLAMREADIRQQALDLARRLLYESEERLRVGALAPLELASVKAEVASREKDVIDARTALDQKRYRLVYLAADSTLLRWESAVAPGDSPGPQLPAEPLETHLAAAFELRPDLRQARLMLAKGELEVWRTRNGILPRLDFYVSLGGTSYAATFADALTHADSGAYAVGAGFTLSAPATNGAARQRFARARFTREQLQESIVNLERLVQLEVRSAVAETARARQWVLAAGSALALQQEKLAAEQQKLAAGKSTLYQVLQAQRDLTAAQLDDARGRVGLATAVTDLHLKEGTLLEHRGVKGF